ncbi:hypothetical protein [Mycolicibacterium lutetiense]
MSDKPKQALCCTCGTVRTCRRSRNYRPENYWLSGPIDLDWHRETGELKCSECGRVTTHALLHPEGDQLRDHAEMMQRVATGNSHGHFKTAELAEVRRKFRQGFPRNPELNHFWWGREAEEAWATGERTVIGLCGEPVTLHRNPTGPSSRVTDSEDSQVIPKIVRDQEYEDPDTGVSWREMDCVDCLRVWHLELLRQRRQTLSETLTKFLAELLSEEKGGYPKRIDLRTVNALVEAFESVNAPGLTAKTESAQ